MDWAFGQMHGPRADGCLKAPTGCSQDFTGLTALRNALLEALRRAIRGPGDSVTPMGSS